MSWLTGGIELGGEVVFLASPSQILLCAAGGAMVLALSWLSARRARHRLLHLLVLLPAVGAVALALARPVQVDERVALDRGRLVVMVDDSRSMAVLEQGRPRHEAVGPLVAALDGPDVDLLTFGSTLRAGVPPTWGRGETDLAMAFKALEERYAGERLAGVAIITDGIDRGMLRREWLEGEGIPALDLPGPLTIYGVGSPSRVVDLAIEDVETGGFAFVRAPFTLKARVAGAAFPGQRVVVTLSRDGALVDRQSVTLDDEGAGVASFTVTPTREGRSIWEVAVPVPEGDAVPGNNTQSVVVKVVRDRMRILQVSGSPSMDQAFLRRFLKQDPAVDLVSFFILRTHEDMGAGYSDVELALIPFPYEDLFTRDLGSFDLVIFQNFDHGPYFRWQSSRLLENIATYVRQGGAFAMVGGDRSFDLGRYADTPVGAILPVRLGVPGSAVDTAPFTPRLTGAGLRHPITAMPWADLSPMDGLNLSMGAADGAVVLLEHPSLRGAGGEPLPVLAVRSVGRGRTLALMGDSSWRWAFGEAGRGRGNQAYLRFWKNVMRWLVAAPDRGVSVVTDREQHRPGDEVLVTVRVRDDAFEPVEGVPVALELAGPGESLGPFTAATGADGEVSFRAPVDAPGAWRARARAEVAGGATAETVFAVVDREPELAELTPDHQFLAALAEASGGRFHPPGEAAPPTLDPEAGRRVEELVERPLWDMPLLPILVAISGSAAWWFRRRGGAR